MPNQKLSQTFKLLSVIIPAYKQERTIRQDITSIAESLDKLKISYEVIVVVDGVGVDDTWDQAKKIRRPQVDVIGYPVNKGKGYAVRYGMARSKGDLIAFMDAGMDLNPDGISMLLEHMKWYDADIVVGSKRHPASQVHYPPIRRVYSFGYQLVVRLLFGLKIKDTQVGLKLFRRRVLEEVLPRLLVKEYAFDIEMISVSDSLGYRKIYEAPVQLRHQFSSSVNWRVVLKMLKDTLAVFYRLKIRRYYTDGNERKWKFDPDLNFRVNIG